jgi:hypothetical protein
MFFVINYVCTVTRNLIDRQGIQSAFEEVLVRVRYRSVLDVPDLQLFLIFILDPD